MQTVHIEHARMRHMFVGRLVSHHVMIFEPVSCAAHLTSLAAFVSRSVLTPSAAHALAAHNPVNVAVIRLAESAELADGDWPDFNRTLTRHEVGARKVLSGPGVPDSAVLALVDAVEILTAAGLGVFAELAVGALVAEAPEVSSDLRDGVLIPDRSAGGAEGQLAAVLAAIPRSWGWAGLGEWHALQHVLAPVRIEDAFVAGCVAEIVDRVPDLAGRLPVLSQRAAETARELTDAKYLDVVALKQSSLLAELLLCWWPGMDRVVHLFTSELDYLTKLPSPASSTTGDPHEPSRVDELSLHRLGGHGWQR